MLGVYLVSFSMNTTTDISEVEYDATIINTIIPRTPVQTGGSQLGPIWLSSRLLSARPRAHITWVFFTHSSTSPLDHIPSPSQNQKPLFPPRKRNPGNTSVLPARPSTTAPLQTQIYAENGIVSFKTIVLELGPLPHREPALAVNRSPRSDTKHSL